MAPRCYQTLENGQRCSAPAIYTSKYCRHHDPQLLALKEARPKDPEAEPLILPQLVDKTSVLAALNLVLHALSEGRIKRSVAHTLLSAIRFGYRLLTEIAEEGLSVHPTRQAAARPAAQSVARLAASRDPKLDSQLDPQKRAEIFRSCYESSDKFVEQMMEQAHQLLARSPRPDPVFMRA